MPLTLKQMQQPEVQKRTHGRRPGCISLKCIILSTHFIMPMALFRHKVCDCLFKSSSDVNIEDNLHLASLVALMSRRCSGTRVTPSTLYFQMPTACEFLYWLSLRNAFYSLLILQLILVVHNCGCSARTEGVKRIAARGICGPGMVTKIFLPLVFFRSFTCIPCITLWGISYVCYIGRRALPILHAAAPAFPESTAFPRWIDSPILFVS